MSKTDPRFQHVRAIHDSQIPHVKWIDLYGNGTAYECAIVQTDQFNQIWFIRIDQLDQVDRERLQRMVFDRRARQYTLAEIMSQTTLLNGENGLKYFHQLVSVLMPSGEITRPSQGKLGLAPMPVAHPGHGAQQQQYGAVTTNAAGQVQPGQVQIAPTAPTSPAADGDVVIV